MITGLGLDVVHLPGFREQLAQPGTVFEERTFTVAERRECRLREDPPLHLAARYAAKEAWIKAWSGGFWGQRPQVPSVDLREIEVVSDAWGRPAIRLHGALAALVGEAPSWHLSLSHDGDVVAAVVLGQVSG